MRKKQSITILAAVSMLIAGCGLFGGDSYEVDFQTDEPAYFATTSTSIAMTIRNTGDVVVYYVCAGNMDIERYLDGEFVDSFGSLPNCASLDPGPIEPGETEERELALDEHVIKWVYDGDDIAEATYRLRLELFEDTDFVHELDLEEQRSNEFRLNPPTR